MPDSVHNSLRLMDLVRNAIRRKHYSDRPKETYVHWIWRFIFFHGKRHSREMGQAEVAAFLNHLARDRVIYTHVMNKGGRGVRSPLDRAGPPRAGEPVARYLAA